MKEPATNLPVRPPRRNEILKKKLLLEYQKKIDTIAFCFSFGLKNFWIILKKKTQVFPKQNLLLIIWGLTENLVDPG